MGGYHPPPDSFINRQLYNDVYMHVCVFKVFLFSCTVGKCFHRKVHFTVRITQSHLKTVKCQHAWREPLKANTNVKLPLSSRITNKTLLVKCFREARLSLITATWSSDRPSGLTLSPSHRRGSRCQELTLLLFKARKGAEHRFHPLPFILRECYLVSQRKFLIKLTRWVRIRAHSPKGTSFCS